MRSIMKKNILIISLLFLTLTAGAQNAAQARKILDKTASVIGHKGGATAKFQMKGKADTTRLVFLCKDNRPIIPVYIEKGNAKITLLPTEMTVSGTRQNDLFYSFLKQKIAYDNSYEDMSQRRISMSRQGLDARRMEIIQDSLRIIVDECEEMICDFMALNYNEPAAVGVFMMLSAGPANDVPALIKRILDAAPDYFLEQSYVDGYTRRMGYNRLGSVD